jgi:hypothetical protein
MQASTTKAVFLLGLDAEELLALGTWALVLVTGLLFCAANPRGSFRLPVRWLPLPSPPEWATVLTMLGVRRICLACAFL